MNGVDNGIHKAYSRTGSLVPRIKKEGSKSSIGPPRSHRGHFEQSVYWGMVIIAGIGFLLVPALASGAEEEIITLFRDDFESDDNPWWHTKGQGTANVRDGYLFLNLSGTGEGSFAKLDGSRLSQYTRWQYAGLELRLRCIGDLEGMRSWGLSDFLVSQTLLHGGDDDPLSGYRVLLNYIQPEYTSPYWAGLQAQVTKVSAYHFAPDRLNAFFNESLSGIDMTEWHTYIILYENGERKFLIDGEEVASTPIVPIGIMGVEILIANECWDPNELCPRTGHSPILGDYRMVDINTDESIQVDFVHVFWSKEVFDSISEKVSNLLSQANEALDDLEKTGSDISEIRDVYQEAVERWENYHFDVSSTLESIISLSGHWDKIGSYFSLAESLINGLDEENPQKSTLERTFREARSAWNSAIGSVENLDYFDNYYREADALLLDIIENLEARNAIIEGNLFNVTEMNLVKIADTRKKLMDTNKFNQSKKLFDSGEYAAALTYLNQIGEPGPVLLLSLFLLFPVLKRLRYR